MEHGADVAAALTVALALAAGVITQSVSQHIRVPGIALLMFVGVVLGPDVLGVVHPETLGSGLSILVGMAVAVILFEGGMGLNFRELRRQNRPIRLLLIVGPLITTVGGALAARYFLGWSWAQSFLFGTLVIVTGPTVIQPLMRRIKVKRKVRTVLEAEGVFIDAIGATIAVVALSLVTQPPGGLTDPLFLFVQKIGFGAVAGAVVGVAIAAALRSPRDLVPEGMENIFTLSIVLALYQISHSIFPESGIAAVTVAGLVVGNVHSRVLPELRDFKEQLTVMLIGMLFVLLAADVGLGQVFGLGMGAIWTVLVLMLVVRPLTVLLSTWGSELTLKEKGFIAWVGPRGIVAAAVASLFAEELEAAGIDGGIDLRALVFLVIGMTVVVQGMTSGVLARLLGVRRAADSGFVILGANALGLALGRALRHGGEEVVFMDANPHNSRRAEDAGFRSIFGNALEQRPLQLAELDTRTACVALTQNEEMNLLFLQKARVEYRVPRGYVPIRADEGRITLAMVNDAGGHVLFGGPCDLGGWSSRLDQKQGRVARWVWEPREGVHPDSEGALAALREETGRVLLLAFKRGSKAFPVDERWQPKPGDMVYVGMSQADAATAADSLERVGFREDPLPVESEGPVLASAAR